MRLWIGAGATVVLIAIVTISQFQQQASSEPETSEPESLVTNDEQQSITQVSGSQSDLVEVVNIEAELSQPTPLPPQPLPFVRFDEPPYANYVQQPTDENVVQVEFVEPKAKPTKSKPVIVDGVPLGSVNDRY